MRMTSSAEGGYSFNIPSDTHLGLPLENDVFKTATIDRGNDWKTTQRVREGNSGRGWREEDGEKGMVRRGW